MTFSFWNVLANVANIPDPDASPGNGDVVFDLDNGLLGLSVPLNLVGEEAVEDTEDANDNSRRLFELSNLLILPPMDLSQVLRRRIESACFCLVPSTRSFTSGLEPVGDEGLESERLVLRPVEDERRPILVVVVVVVFPLPVLPYRANNRMGAELELA